MHIYTRIIYQAAGNEKKKKTGHDIIYNLVYENKIQEMSKKKKEKKKRSDMKNMIELRRRNIILLLILSHKYTCHILLHYTVIRGNLLLI